MLKKNTEFHKILTKKALICFDEKYIRIINKKEQLPLFNYLKKKNLKFISFVIKNKKSNKKNIVKFYKKKIIISNFFYILDLIFNLKKIIFHLHDLYKNTLIRGDLNNPSKIRPLFITIFRSLLIIFKDYGYFKKIAKKYEALYVVCYYNSCNLAPILSFKLINKPVYDIQHGYIGNKHFCYNKKIILSKNIFIPNKFILWRGENQLDFNKKNIVRGSYPETKNIKKKKINNKIRIGLTMDTKKISNSVINFINKNSKKYIWLIKQHPADNLNIFEREDFKKICHNKNLHVFDKKMHIIEWLEHIDMHFTEFSSSAYEAYICGIYTITNNYRFCKRYKKKLGKFLIYTKFKKFDNVLKKINVIN